MKIINQNQLKLNTVVMNQVPMIAMNPPAQVTMIHTVHIVMIHLTIVILVQIVTVAMTLDQVTIQGVLIGNNITSIKVDVFFSVNDLTHEVKFKIYLDMELLEILKSGKVFLGGTCAGSTWRETLMPIFDKYGITYFNPVVKDWNEEAQKIEDKMKSEIHKVHLYVITPEQKGYYSFGEIIDSAWRTKIEGHPNSMVFIKLGTWEKHNEKALSKLGKLAESINPDQVKFISMNEITEFDAYLK